MSPLPNGLPAPERTVRSLGRALERRYPAVRRPLLWAWTRYIQLYARLNAWAHAQRYARRTGLSPFEVFAVDPDDITFLAHADGYPQQTHTAPVFPDSKFKYAGTVRGGDWDRGGVRFAETDLYRAYEAHFERGVDWAATPFVERVEEFLAAGIELWGCTTPTEFERRCADIDSLYDSIRRHGYRSQRELAGSGVPDPIGECDMPLTVRVVYDELTVCIGRDGDLLLFDGRNRLAIAKLLGLESIPVWVMVRHERWQTLREELAGAPAARRALRPRLQGHPDLGPLPD